VASPAWEVRPRDLSFKGLKGDKALHGRCTPWPAAGPPRPPHCLNPFTAQITVLVIILSSSVCLALDSSALDHDSQVGATPALTIPCCAQCMAHFLKVLLVRVLVHGSSCSASTFQQPCSDAALESRAWQTPLSCRMHLQLLLGSGAASIVIGHLCPHLKQDRTGQDLENRTGQT
jgi:hypothetical protein